MKSYKGALIKEYEDNIFLYNPTIQSQSIIKKNGMSLEDAIKYNYNYLLENMVLLDNYANHGNIVDFFTNKEKFNFNNIIITEAMSFDCNLSCSYCMQQNTFKDVHTLSPEQRVNIWKNLINIFNSKSISLHLFGGEPFYDINFVDRLLSNAINEKIPISSIGAVTNGTICNNSLIEIINKYNISYLQITLDGNKNVHNIRRRSKTGFSSFDLIINNIEKFLKYTNCEIIINTVIDKSNYSNYKELVDFIIDKFDVYVVGDSPRIIFNLGTECHPVNKSDYTRDNVLSDEDFNRMFYDNMDYLIQSNVIINSILPTPMCINDCVKDIIIGPNGDIYSCISGIGVDKFRICTYDEFINKPQLFLLESIKKSSSRKNDKCKVCDYTGMCNGGCYYNKVIENLDNSCQKSIFNNTIDRLLDCLVNVHEVSNGRYRKRS